MKVIDSEEELLKVFGEETGKEFQEELIKRMIEAKKYLDQKSPRLYTVTGQVMYPDSKHSGRMYSYETFLKAVADYEKTNNSDEEDI
jgi:YesN/AraC family two-component response regulator